MSDSSDKERASERKLAPIISLEKWKRDKANRFESLVKRAERTLESRRKPEKPDQ